MVGRRHVEDAVDCQRRRFEEPARECPWAETIRNRLRYSTAGNRPLRIRVRAIGPRQREVLDVALIDLIERAVVTARVVAVVRRPRVDRRFAEQRRIEPRLRAYDTRDRDKHNEDEPRKHGGHKRVKTGSPCSPCLRGL